MTHFKQKKNGTKLGIYYALSSYLIKILHVPLTHFEDVSKRYVRNCSHEDFSKGT